MRASAAYRMQVAQEPARQGDGRDRRGATRASRASCEAAAMHVEPEIRRRCVPTTAAASRPQPLPHDQRAKHVHGRRDLYRRHARADGHAAPRARGCRRRRGAASLASTWRRCAPRPGVVAVLTAADIPGRNDIAARPAATSRSLPRPRSCSTASRCSRVVAEDARRRAPRGAARQGRDRGRDGRCVTVEDALARGEPVLPDYAFGRGDAAGRAARRAASPRRHVPRSAGRSISTSKARSRSRCPARTATCYVHSSTQHPTEVQHVVARVLGLPDAR